MKMNNWTRGFCAFLIWAVALIFPGTSFGTPATLTDDGYTIISPRNFGDNGTLLAESPDARTFLKFSLSTLPSGISGGEVAKATLKLWVNSVRAPGSFDVHRVSGAWAEGTLTSATAPTLGTVEAAGVAVGLQSQETFLTVELTQLVKDWLDGVLSNDGIAIAPGAGLSAEFNSKENKQTSHEPQLEITLAERGDISAVNAGTGLVGGGDSGDVTLSVDTNQVQQRVAGSCLAGSSIRQIDANGNVVCEPDDNSGGTVTAVTATAPLVSSEGSTPNISLPGVIIGTFNTAIGTDALLSNTTGGFNTASGVHALLSNTTGSLNTASGANALLSNTTGNYNTASGFDALLRNTTGDYNTASGGGALRSNTTGSSNTASGVNALGNNTTGGGNTASGDGALSSNTTGNYNTASGVNALVSNTTGSFNIAVGYSALRDNTTGNYNTASGEGALLSNTTGSSNTASGVNALENNTTGTGNTAIGAGADVSTGNLTNATAIGAGAIVNASNKIRLGHASVTVIEAQVGLTVVSDATQKENFQPVDGEGVLKKIQGLSLTSWNLIGHDPKQFRHYGPTAQEFFDSFGSDGLGTIGTSTTITSTDIDGILMIAVQTLEKRTSDQTEEIEMLRAENDALKARLEALEKLPFVKETLAQN